MRRIALLIVVLAAIVSMASFAIAAPSTTKGHSGATHSGQQRTCTVEEFELWSAKVWDQARWRRGEPPESTIAAQRKWLSCAANPKSRRKMQAAWKELRTDYYSARSARLWRNRVTPYYGCTSLGGCHRWAIPAYIVDCESGGRYHSSSAPNGAYSLLAAPLQGVPTWESWRPGWAAGYSLPYEAPAKAQDEAAHRLWVAYGSSPWECA